MKRVRLERWGATFLPPRNPRLQWSESAHASSSPGPPCSTQHRHFAASPCIRQEAQAQLASAPKKRGRPQAPSHTSTPTHVAQSLPPSPLDEARAQSTRLPQHSAKLAALHARLSLPARLPLSTLARCLVHASADPRPEFNNSALATIGQDVMGYYTTEWLLCNYPRLPMPIVFAAQYAYVGPKTLAHMRAEWGVEPVAAPGEEVDPGLLQFKRLQPGNAMADGVLARVKDLEGIPFKKGSGRSNEEWPQRRGYTSRIVYDDEFGDLRSGLHDQVSTLRSAPAGSKGRPPVSEADELDDDSSPPAPDDTSLDAADTGASLEDASATFIRAVFGALYLHVGTQHAQAFHTAHVLSRHLPLHTLFSFKHPTRDLSFLCKREGFDPPVARLVSETGRHSRTPVFVVGVFSGDDKLGEDAGASLDEARIRAAAAALRSWYLYSPLREDVCLPSQSDKAPNGWKPQMIDIGEIVT